MQWSRCVHNCLAVACANTGDCQTVVAHNPDSRDKLYEHALQVAEDSARSSSAVAWRMKLIQADLIVDPKKDSTQRQHQQRQHASREQEHAQQSQQQQQQQIQQGQKAPQQPQSQGKTAGGKARHAQKASTGEGSRQKQGQDIVDVE